MKIDGNEYPSIGRERVRKHLIVKGLQRSIAVQGGEVGNKEKAESRGVATGFGPINSSEMQKRK